VDSLVDKAVDWQEGPVDTFLLDARYIVGVRITDTTRSGR
jgi:hypothetical protein